MMIQAGKWQNFRCSGSGLGLQQEVLLWFTMVDGSRGHHLTKTSINPSINHLIISIMEFHLSLLTLSPSIMQSPSLCIFLISSSIMQVIICAQNSPFYQPPSQSPTTTTTTTTTTPDTSAQFPSQSHPSQSQPTAVTSPQHSNTYDQRCDIWSLGVLLYELAEAQVINHPHHHDL